MYVTAVYLKLFFDLFFFLKFIITLLLIIHRSIHVRRETDSNKGGGRNRPGIEPQFVPFFFFFNRGVRGHVKCQWRLNAPTT